MRQGFYGGDAGFEYRSLDDFEGTAFDVFIFDDEPGVERVGFCVFEEETAGGF